MKLLVCLIVCFLGAALAQFNTTTLPEGASPDVSTAFVFPDHPARVVTAGDIVEVLLGFVNNGDREFNITSVSASLNHPLDYRYFIQNYSRAEYGLLVQPKEQVSVSYRFRPDPLLEPRDFGLVVSVFYEDESGKNFTNAFYNGTITIVEADTGFDLQQLFLTVGFFGVLGLGGYFALQSFGIDPTGKKERRASGSFRTPKVTKEGSFEITPSASPKPVKLDDDWLSGTNVRTASPAKRRASGPRI
eukprot:Phypoly_transcript_14727.p1 GENE.Phypoly_transcript_14727~~Phypoly_transcript_14727.p1  ORF type:complete len:246 (+),score=51.86 Phypoly_transcript_14727:114-851(+)